MSRRVIRVSGADRVKFLQNLVTNDVSRIGDSAVYSALLTPQGKFVVDFFVVPDGETLLLDADTRSVDDLLKRLTMYRLRAQVTLELTDLVVSRGVGPMPEGGFVDPRDPALGWRLIGPSDVSEDVDWDALRVEHLVPEFGAELVANDSYILEFGFERLHGVDFRKGCYVGQEVTARMKHKTELKKGLVRVHVAASVPVGTPIVTGDGRSVGQIGTWSGGRALAYLKFDFAGDALSAGGQPLTVES
jgi:tRNA-modifying protein YgfZ